MKRRIQVYAGLSLSSVSRAVALGVLEYSRLVSDWDVGISWAIGPEAVLHPADGYLFCMSADSLYAEMAEHLRAPCILVGGVFESAEHPFVSVDNFHIGRMAAEFFLSRGYRRFMFIGDMTDESAGRRKGYCDTLSAHGLHVDCLKPTPETRDGPWVEHSFGCLMPLQFPIAVFFAHDSLAQTAYQLSELFQLNIPYDMAVLSVDNDDFLCKLRRPTLSSIDFDAARLGFKAAAGLDLLLKGKLPEESPFCVQPIGVVERESGGQKAVDDPLASEALRLIHKHACYPCTASDIAARLGVSRRTLEMNCSRFLGTTPYDLIKRVRMERVEELLLHTELTVREIAGMCGFTYLNHFYKTFSKSHNGLSPRCWKEKESADRS